MRALQFSLLMTASVALLLAAYVMASAYSCSAFLAGEFGGCLSLAGQDLLRSSAAQAGAAGCAMLLILSIVSRRQG